MKLAIAMILMAALGSGSVTLSDNMTYSLLCSAADASAVIAIERDVVTPAEVTAIVTQLRELLDGTDVVSDIVVGIQTSLPPSPLVDAVLLKLKYTVEVKLGAKRRLRIENILVGWERRAQLWSVQ